MILSLIVLAVLLYISYKDVTKGLVVTVIMYMTIDLFSIGRLHIPTIMSIIFLCVSLTRKVNKIIVGPFPFTIPFLLCMASYILTFLLCGNFGISTIINKFCEFSLAYSLWILYLPIKRNRKFFVWCTMIYIFVCSSYGVYEAISGHRWFTEFLSKNNIHMVEIVSENIRTGLHRTQSLTIWNECYGTALVFSLFVLLRYAIYRNIKVNGIYVLLIILIIFGIISTNSRTIYVSTLFIVSSTVVGFSRNYTIIFAFLLAGFFFTIIGGRYIMNGISILFNQDLAGGSSVDMRMEQFYGTLSLVNKSALLGKGYEAVSWATNNYHYLMRGCESIVFTSILERGFFGLITICVLWVWIFVYLFMKREYMLAMFAISYFSNKILTLTYGVNEVFVLLTIIPLLRQKSIKKTSVI